MSHRRRDYKVHYKIPTNSGDMTACGVKGIWIQQGLGLLKHEPPNMTFVANAVTCKKCRRLLE